MAQTQEAFHSEQDLSEGKLQDIEQPQYVHTPPSRQAGANQPLNLQSTNKEQTNKGKQTTEK